MNKKTAMEELGKGFINLANLLFVLFLINNYLQKESINYFLVFLFIYGFFVLYWSGYHIIKGATNE